MSVSRGREILAWLRSHQGEMTDLLVELVKAESPSTDPASQARVFGLLREPLEEVGLRVELLPGEESGGQLLARPPEGDGRDARQLLLGHVDTVWPLGTLEQMPVVVDDGVLRGPGSFDMKGGLAQMVFALRALRALGMEPSVAPLVFLNSDEEVGSGDSEARIRTLAGEASRALVLEPALGPEGRIKTARRGTGQFRIRVTGKRAHSGLDPEAGASAILELAHLIRTLHGLTDRERGTHVNVGVVRGGVRANVVAPDAEALVDVRVMSVEDGEALERRVRGLEARTPGTSILVEGGVDRPPMEPTPGNRILWEAVRGEARNELGVELEGALSGGASDGNFTSQYTPTLDGLGPVGDGAHALHEHVVLHRMPERAAVLALALLLPARLGEPEGGA